MRLTFDLVGCARCRGDGHSALTFEPLAYPVECEGGASFTHWAACPTNGQPILMAMTEGNMTEDSIVDKAVIKLGANGQYRVRAYSSNGEIIYTSEQYVNLSHARRVAAVFGKPVEWRLEADE